MTIPMCERLIASNGARIAACTLYESNFVWMIVGDATGRSNVAKEIKKKFGRKRKIACAIKLTAFI